MNKPTIYIDGEPYRDCALKGHFAQIKGDRQLVPGVMRVVTERASQAKFIAERIDRKEKVTVRYPSGPSEEREAACYYAGGELLADTRRAKVVTA